MVYNNEQHTANMHFRKINSVLFGLVSAHLLDMCDVIRTVIVVVI